VTYACPSFATACPVTATAIEGSTYTVLGSGMTWPGATFNFWSIQETSTCLTLGFNDPGCITYQSGAQVTVTGDMTFDSTYTANAYLSYSGNGSDGGTTPTTQSNIDVQPISVESNTFTKTGFQFTGWSTQPDGSGTAYSAGDAISLDSTSYTLYAQWTANSTCYVVVGGVLTDGSACIGAVVIDSSVTSIGQDAFNRNEFLTSVVIPNSVTSIGVRAFVDDASLTSVTIGNGVTSIGNNAFDEDTALTSIVIPASVSSIGDQAFVWETSLTSIVIPVGVTSIGWNLFGGDTALVSVVIPDSVISIGDLAFVDDASLSSITYCGLATEVLNYSYPNGVVPTCPDGHTVTFDNNTGTGSMTSETTDIAAALTTNTFTKIGYTFNGWNSAADGTGIISYADGAIYDFTSGDITLYAQWSANAINYTVTYVPNGATSG